MIVEIGTGPIPVAPTSRNASGASPKLPLVVGGEVATDDQAHAERGDEAVHVQAGDDQPVRQPDDRGGDPASAGLADKTLSGLPAMIPAAMRLARLVT